LSGLDIERFLGDQDAGLAKRAGRVLLVDDSATTCNVVCYFLAQLGISNVVISTDATAAFAILQDGKVDFVIADVEMEPFSGLQLLRAIRSTPGLRHLPVLMMTGSLRHRHVVDAKQGNATGFLLKPFSASNLGVAMSAVAGRPGAPVARSA
jgi:two-component system chemotaxis response regulator CheY